MRENELLPISEFARYTGINRPTLIFYDETGVFSPIKRNEKGYRLYSPRQIISANMVRVLRTLDIPLDNIRELMKSRDPKSIVTLFGQQSKKIMDEVHRLLELHSVMFVFHQTLIAGMTAGPGTIEIRELPDIRVTLGPENHFKKNDTFYAEFLKYCDQAKSEGVNLAFPTGGYFKTIDDFIARPDRPTHFFSLNDKGPHLICSGKYLVGYTMGYYGKVGDMAEKMLDYAKEHNIVLGKVVYQTYLLDEISVSEPEEYLMQISIPIIR